MQPRITSPALTVPGVMDACRRSGRQQTRRLAERAGAPAVIAVGLGATGAALACSPPPHAERIPAAALG